MKSLLIILLSFFCFNLFSQNYSNQIPDSLISDDLSMLKAGSCSSPDGAMNPTTITPPTYTWLDNNGYCNPNTYGNNPTVCWTFIPTSTSITIDSGYSVDNDCNYIAFGNFILYDNSCSIIGTGFTFTGLVPNQQYTWCMEGYAWGGGVNCTGFLDFCPYYFNNSTLPIELLEFNVSATEKGNKVMWTTSSEVNNDYFTIERSIDGINFYVITYVDGAGNSSTQLEYEYVDKDVQNKVNYYRLSQTDHDGTTEVFEVVSVDNTKEQPNLIKIVNMMGKEVDDSYSGVKIYIYDDGTTEKIIRGE